MSVALPEGRSRLRERLLQPDALVRAAGSGQQRGADSQWRRVELRYVDLRSGRHLQVTSYDATQAFTRNVPLAELTATVEELLALPFRTWQVDTVTERLSLRVTKKGQALVTVTASDAVAPSRRHDRDKPRLLPPDDPMLAAVGIANERGIKPSMQAKYRQVEELVRLLASAVDEARAAGRLPEPSLDRPLRAVDLGCGNAYLTFAAFRYLKRRGPVQMTGVDVKEQARVRNRAIAAAIGAEAELTFRRAPIATVDIPGDVDVVLSLHACDTATDEALARGVRWRAPLILAAPCCHHHLQAQLRATPAPGPYELVTRHGILREQLGNTLTDAMRAALLRLHGYRVDVVEFVESRHTPRNTLLRAVWTGAQPAEEVRRSYDELVAAWRVAPRLAELLAESS